MFSVECLALLALCLYHQFHIQLPMPYTSIHSVIPGFVICLAHDMGTHSRDCCRIRFPSFSVYKTNFEGVGLAILPSNYPSEKSQMSPGWGKLEPVLCEWIF
ncbi:hypothetical protein V8G54_024969 [Vigna mungo]|uniref:Secreted protein n=1 Tax=Vigna mungo TaxID=3915 RepID=A0AAQ3N6J8_VIGMU